MTISAVINSYADYPKSKTEGLLNVKPHDVINHQSEQKRAWQITSAVIYALAAAALASLAIMAFCALYSATAAVSILALPAFVPLAIGLLAVVSAIALAALAVKNGIYAHKNNTKLNEPIHRHKDVVQPTAAHAAPVAAPQVLREHNFSQWVFKHGGKYYANDSILFSPNPLRQTSTITRVQNGFQLSEVGAYKVSFSVYKHDAQDKDEKGKWHHVDGQFSLTLNGNELAGSELDIQQNETDKKTVDIIVNNPNAILEFKRLNGWVNFDEVDGLTVDIIIEKI